MGQHYSNPTRENDPAARPNLATFFHPCCGDPNEPCVATDYDDACQGEGWYYQHVDTDGTVLTDSIGPFETEDTALAYARGESDNG